MPTRTATVAGSQTGTAVAAVAVEGVSVELGGRLALEDVSFAVPRGSFMGLIGANGSGKSTLLRAILGILPLAAGRVTIAGRPPTEARDQLAYLPQRRELELDLPLKAIDVVMMGRLRHSGWLRPPSKADRRAAEEALVRAGLADRRNRPIGELSFGQQQRVLFARMLAQEGSILLLDEPMNGVDPTTQELFLQILTSLTREGRTVIMASHDLQQVSTTCDLLCVLNRRLVAFGPTRETLTEEVLREAYGVHLHLMHGDQHLDHILEDVHHHDDG